MRWLVRVLVVVVVVVGVGALFWWTDNEAVTLMLAGAALSGLVSWWITQRAERRAARGAAMANLAQAYASAFTVAERTIPDARDRFAGKPMGEVDWKPVSDAAHEAAGKLRASGRLAGAGSEAASLAEALITYSNAAWASATTTDAGTVERALASADAAGAEVEQCLGALEQAISD